MTKNKRYGWEDFQFRIWRKKILLRVGALLLVSGMVIMGIGNSVKGLFDIGYIGFAISFSGLIIFFIREYFVEQARSAP